MKNRSLILFIFIILLIISIPHLLAAGMDGERVFAGFLLNPGDGASYLAKMQQGWSGSWKFQLPFTAEQGQGAYLFLFYLFLGHLARWLGTPIVWMFHIARMLGAAFFLFSLAWWFEKIFPTRADLFWKTFLLASLGSGLGWLMLLAGVIPFDMWVSEAYPFLSMFSNPHFPTGLALMVLVCGLVDNQSSWQRNLLLTGAGLAVAVINPFGMVILTVLLASWTVWKWIETRRLEWQAPVSVGMLGGPFLLYQYLATLSDPLLSGWNQQNQTLTPNAWDVIASLSPALLFGLIGIAWAFKQRGRPGLRIILLWALLGLVLMYVPFSLQRRFSTGIYLPLAVLAVIGVDWIAQRSARWGRYAFTALMVFSLPTNLLLVGTSLLASTSQPQLLYLTRDESQALMWIKANTSRDAVILASPEASLWIPAFTGRRVIYGHPYETVNAGDEERKVTEFFSQDEWAASHDLYLTEEAVEYLFLGPRERKMGKLSVPQRYKAVFVSGDVTIFAVDRGR